MRVAAHLTTLVASSSATTASLLFRDLDLKSLLGVDLSRDNHFGAPIPPWQSDAHAGWYFGNHPEAHQKLACLSGLLCRILKNFPHASQCPTNLPLSDGYTQTFSNLSGATHADDYLTFGLVETVADCKAMCNSVEGCGFVNTYHDVNGKDGSPLLTCSLFRDCHTAVGATNTSGQTQPDGSVNYITDSDGWCKK